MPDFNLLTAEPKPEISIVVCVYNEAGNGVPLVDQISRAMRGVRYELIYVNDGSTDGTLAELRNIHDANLTVLDLQRNYGQSAALAAGIDAARGDYVVTLDGDQQNDPDDILRLIQYCEANDLDLVAGLRANRQDGYWLRKVPSQLANALIRRTTGLTLRDLGCGLKVARAETAKSLKLYGELHRFILLLAHLDGARIGQLPVNHRARRIGQSKYGLGRTLRVISDLLLLLFLKKYGQKPMHLFGSVGVLMGGAGLLILLVAGFLSLTSSAAGSSSFVIAGLLLLIGGAQVAAFGIMSEMQMRTYYEAQGAKPYKVRRTYKQQASVSSEPLSNRYL
ncbi:glycosyltransferase family 2 protein [Spirosoma rigui]|uniref:glycosyltransferase family 2 protein n=1 Tax=Spirosoma rigui TaxID=564064 RepID=UPI0009AF2461|nr:glycosyltransferase family 2 protein [Spirosoma rigui]